MASEPMSDARLAEIAARVIGDDDTTIYWNIASGALEQAEDDRAVLFAEVERLRACEAALVARHEQAVAVVRETAAMIELEPGVLMTDDDRLPFCPVCNHNDFDATTPGDFRHSANCTVAKARALLAAEPTDATTAQ